MISLSDGQLEVVLTAAKSLPLEKRLAFLERAAARLEARAGTGHPTDADVDAAVRASLAGLLQDRHGPTAA